MRFVASLPTGQDLPRSVEVVLTALGQAWGDVMRRGGFPPLYSSGFRFVPERGTEIWQSPPDLLKSRKGDCEDFVLYRFGELWAAGIRVDVECIYRQAPWGIRSHVRIRRGNAIEDPSLVILGKGKPSWPVKP